MIEFRNKLMIKTYDLYYYLSDNKWFGKHEPVNRKTFVTIITALNKQMFDEFAEKGEVHFPNGLGSLFLTYAKSYYLGNKNNAPKMYGCINWPETKKLWAEDPEARANLVKIRYTDEKRYKISYYNASCKNSRFIIFKATPQNRKIVHKNIVEGKVFGIKKGRYDKRTRTYKLK